LTALGSMKASAQMNTANIAVDANRSTCIASIGHHATAIGTELTLPVHPIGGSLA
jgi:hypothetical protein